MVLGTSGDVPGSLLGRKAYDLVGFMGRLFVGEGGGGWLVDLRMLECGFRVLD